MSTIVRAYGYIAMIINPLEVDQFDELSEKLWEENSDLHINAEGTLIYIDYNTNKSMLAKEDIYGLTLGKDNSMGTVEDFITLTMQAGIPADHTTVHPYSCIWYNGGDSDLDSLTKEQFLYRINS